MKAFKTFNGTIQALVSSNSHEVSSMKAFKIFNSTIQALVSSNSHEVSQVITIMPCLNMIIPHFLKLATTYTGHLFVRQIKMMCGGSCVLDNSLSFTLLSLSFTSTDKNLEEKKNLKPKVHRPIKLLVHKGCCTVFLVLKTWISNSVVSSFKLDTRTQSK